MAGLPGNKAIVGVGPPKSPSGPSSGSVLLKLPGAVNWQLASELRLFPSSIKTPKQLLPERLFATIVFCRIGELLVVKLPPPKPTPRSFVKAWPNLEAAPGQAAFKATVE